MQEQAAVWKIAHALALSTLLLSAAACQPTREPPAVAGSPSSTAVETSQASRLAPVQTEPLKLRIPIQAVMLGTMNEASFVIFQAGTTHKNLSEDDWRRIPPAAITLVGNASLITQAGTGPNDARWVADPEWLRLSENMQSASLAAGQAAVRMDRAALTEATARLAQACQSCHETFSDHLIAAPAP